MQKLMDMKKMWVEFLSTPKQSDFAMVRILKQALRIFIALIRDVQSGHLNMRAMSLVYTTLLSLAPLLAISFSVLKGFGVHNQIEPFLLTVLEPIGRKKGQITQEIIGFVDNIEVGVLGAVGVAILFWTVISLMTKIERAFNYAWNVSQSRNFATRFSDYLSVLLIGPMMIFISIGLTQTAANSDIAHIVTQFEISKPFIKAASVLVPYAFLTGAFAFIYFFMPNTNVRLVPALIGGGVTAIMWKILGVVFGALVVSSASYSAIYSAFATLIIFMLLLYAAWMVLLLGASIAYYVQNPSNVSISRDVMVMSNRTREDIALSVLYLVGLHFYKKEKDVTTNDLVKSLALPVRLIEETLFDLKAHRLVVQNVNNDQGYTPGLPFDTLSLHDALRLIREVGTCGRVKYHTKASEVILEQCDTVLKKQFDKTSLKDWVFDTEKRKEKTKKRPQRKR